VALAFASFWMMADSNPSAKSALLGIFSHEQYKNGIRFILASDGSLNGAHSAFYAAGASSGSKPTIAVDKYYLRGLIIFRNLLHRFNRNGRFDNFRLAPQGNKLGIASYLDMFIFNLLAESILAHEPSHVKTESVLESQQAEEIRVMTGPEKLYHDISVQYFGRQKRISSIEYFFHILKRENRLVYLSVARPDRNRVHRADPKRMRTGKPNNVMDFVLHFYSVLQKNGGLPMADLSQKTPGAPITHELAFNKLSRDAKIFLQTQNINQNNFVVVLSKPEYRARIAMRRKGIGLSFSVYRELINAIDTLNRSDGSPPPFLQLSEQTLNTSITEVRLPSVSRTVL
jgi:hypothetical protein